jgi:hypothetical protein
MEAKLVAIREARLQKLEAEMEALYQSKLADLFSDHPSTWMEKAAIAGSQIGQSKENTWTAWVNDDTFTNLVELDEALCRKYHRMVEEAEETHLREKRIERMLMSSFGIKCNFSICEETFRSGHISVTVSCSIKVPETALQKRKENEIAVAKTVIELVKQELELHGPSMAARCEQEIFHTATEENGDGTTVPLKELDGFFATIVDRVAEIHPDMVNKNEFSNSYFVCQQAARPVEEYLRAALGIRKTSCTISHFDKKLQAYFNW